MQILATFWAFSFSFVAAQHSEIWRLATSMEDYKSEIENWDLGAGIYISFYLLRSSLQEDNITMSELVWKLILNIEVFDFNMGYVLRFTLLSTCIAVIGNSTKLGDQSLLASIVW